ncbi:uncharacterized protein BROUX77_003968 [Berkeleyomyces rouxiae]|uniref:uncharacterized protein n=1 Tax=Berkeleyomyces rouxiae TaxID=2035830 RepID=UPI003B7A2EF6
MQPGPRSVVVGDFNLHHSAWDPRCATDDNDAELLLAWMEERALLLGNADGEPTHELGSVIDLTIMSSPLFVTGASVELRDDLTCGSDHFPLLVSIPLPGHTVVPSPAGRFLMDKLDKKKFDAACKAGAARLDDLVREYRRSDGQIPEKKHIDDFARLLQNVILDALVASTPRSLGKAKSFPWWNKECSVARAEQSAARNRVEKATTQAAAQEARTERREAKKRLRRALRSAARAFYADLLAKVTDTRDLFRIVKWRTKDPHRHSPALSPADGAEATVQDTTEKIALLRSVHMPSALQVEPRTRGSRTEAPPTRARITRDEVEAALWRPRNTAPGPDGLSKNVLKLAWPSLKRQVTHLFNASFFWGHHPASFKEAKVIALPKPNKKDRSSPRAYRLISLLPTLAKCLERIVARRLSCWALEAGHIQDNYAGAVPGRSAEDMCLRLVHSLERTADLRGESSVLTFDIKGAFDAVHPNRMVKRLADLGCPAGTCRWVSSFLAGRRASLTLDGVSDALQPTGGSLPQGSPISPILFMLFMSPLFKMPLPRTLRGYADDGCLVNSDSSLEGNCSVLSRSLELVDSWCTDNGMALDLTKSELLHVTRKRHGQNPSLRLPDGSTLEAISPRETLRWLGVRWSRNLSFVPHIRDVAQRTAPAIRGIQILSGCWKGAPIKGALTAVRACVVAKLSYAAATWWRPTPPNAPLSHGLLGASRLLDRTVRRGLRAALPLYCTTPCAIYNLASGFPPMRYALDNLLGSAALRVALAPPNHPLGSVRPMWGILGELRSMLPYELSTSFPPPCKGKLPSTRAPIRGDKEAAAAAHLALVRSSSPSDLWLYTDGSKLSPNRVGAGWVIIQGGQVLLSGNRPVPFRAEVHDAEVLAIAEAITAVDLRDKPRCRKVWICSDNMAAARSEFCAWVTTAFRAWWEAEGRNSRPHLRRPVQAPKKAWTSLLDETDRNLARAVLTALSGHGDFAAYHRRFEHEDAVLSCPLCGADTSPEHIWVCHHNPQRVSSSFFQKLIGTKRGACWLAAKAAKAPTALLAHRRMRPDTQAQDAAPPAPPLPPGDGVPSGSPP